MPDPLVSVREAVEAKRRADVEYRAALAAAVDHGCTLQAVADAAGCSKQNVHKRIHHHKGGAMSDSTRIAQRLEELRTELRAERISYGELAELQDLAEYIEEGDVELLEAAGVPEFPEVAS